VFKGRCSFQPAAPRIACRGAAIMRIARSRRRTSAVSGQTGLTARRSLRAVTQVASLLGALLACRSVAWLGPMEACSRRQAVLALLPATAAVSSLGAAGPADAYVKGVEPPEDYGLLKGWKRKKTCFNKAECQELSVERTEQEFGSAKDISYQQTSSGVRYKDLAEGTSSLGVAAAGQKVDVKYKVMRSGKRSNDGLSGEASTIFSWGYGEEDGEPPKAVLSAKLGEGRLVKALDEGIVGMAVGGKRRVQVRPEGGLGWMRFGKCAERVDAVGLAVGLPGAGAANQEACMDKSLLPQPASFSAERRFSRRFDESLIVEVELMSVS